MHLSSKKTANSVTKKNNKKQLIHLELRAAPTLAALWLL
jgi:hypothetical protein